ncbi:MAG: hypothetical protein ACUVRT_05120 [Armatimonadota bacterium]
MHCLGRWKHRIRRNRPGWTRWSDRRGLEYFHYVDVGANGGAVCLDETTITESATLIATNIVRSKGKFLNDAGQEVAWTATSWIAPGSQVYQTRLDFEALGGFGTVRIIAYLDGDVYNSWANHLIVLGSGATVQLLTLGSSRDFGVAQAAQGTIPGLGG